MMEFTLFPFQCLETEELKTLIRAEKSLVISVKKVRGKAVFVSFDLTK